MNNDEPSDVVHQYMNEFGSRVVAQTGRPEDRCHLGKLILQGLKDAPDFILQVDGATGESETCQSVLQRSVRCATAFKNVGLKTHDVIVLMGPNHIHISIPIYGSFYTGVGVACVDMTLTVPARIIFVHLFLIKWLNDFTDSHIEYNFVEELKDAFSCIKPNMVFCQNERALDVQRALDEIHLYPKIVTFGEGHGFCSFNEFLEEHGDCGSTETFAASDFDPADTIALLMSTSGTTGVPKSAAITHKNIAVTIPYMWLTFDKYPTPIQSMLTASPLQWYSALYQITFSPIARVTRIQSSLPMIPEHAYELINKYKPHHMLMSPNMLSVLLKPGATEKCDFSSLKKIFCGGSAPTDAIFQNLKAASPNTQLYVLYGLTELTGVVCNYTCQVPGSVGRPIGLYKYRLVNPETMEDVTEPGIPGELWVKGPGLFKGYYNNDEQTAKALSKDGWMKTGDLLKKDENCNFYFVERLKMLLKYRSHHISPTELEQVIIKHPGVFEVAVTGVQDEQAGDLAVACVVPHDGYNITAQEIKDMVKEALTDTKQLRGGVVFLKNLPLTSTSKVNRAKLASIVREMQRL